MRTLLNAQARRPRNLLFGLALALVCAWNSACKPGESSTHPGALDNTGWHEVRSRHFQMVGTLDTSEMKELADLFEREQAALEVALYHQQLDSDVFTRVVVLRNLAELEMLRTKKGAGGFSVPYLFAEFERTPTVVFYGRPEGRTVMTFRHELTHRLLNFSLRQVPLWLNEGLATYHEATHIEGDQLVLGDAPLKRGITKLHEPLVENEGTSYRVSIPLDWLRTYDKLAEISYDDFYQNYTRNRDKADATRDAATNYTSAWHAVHTLLHGPEPVRNAFSQALASGSSKGSMQQALDEMFETVGIDNLNKAFYEHANRRETILWRAPMPKVSTGDLSVREMQSADVDGLLANLAQAETPTRGAALERLRSAAKAGDQRAMMHLGTFQLLAGSESAAQTIAAAMRAAPSDPDAAAAYVQLQLAESQSTDASADATLQVAALTLKSHARSSHHFRVLGELQYQTEDFAGALTSAKEAVKHNSSDPACLEFLARVTFEVGEAKDAHAYQRMAIDRLSEYEPGERVRRYEEALAQYAASAGL